MVYISFPSPPAGWTKATLVLSLNKVWTGGAINVYQFAWGGISIPGPADTLSLFEGDPRVFFETESFEDIPGYLRALIFGDPVHSIGVDVYQQKAVVDTEVGRALQVTFDPRVNGALTAAIMFPNGWRPRGGVERGAVPLPDMLTGLTQGFKFFAGASSATKPDDAYFSSIWKTQVGRAGTLLAGNGGAKSHGNDGWSTRFDMFMSPGERSPALWSLCADAVRLLAGAKRLLRRRASVERRRLYPGRERVAPLHDAPQMQHLRRNKTFRRMRNSMHISTAY